MKTNVNVLDTLGDVELPQEVKDKLANVEVTIPETELKGYVRKEVFDKKASEVAELSRKAKEQVIQNETLEETKNREIAEMKEQLANLQKDKQIAGYKAKYLGLGYDEDLATRTATALMENDFETVIANQQLFNDTLKQKSVSTALDNQPNLSKGKQPSADEIQKAESDKLRSQFGLPIL